MRRLVLWAGLTCIAAVLGWLFITARYPLDRVATTRETASLSLHPEHQRAKVEKELIVPVSPLDKSDWLTKARDDPDPRVRLSALDAWARNPTDSLDPLTYALVDADEQVRARAQELLEEELSRR